MEPAILDDFTAFKASIREKLSVREKKTVKSDKHKKSVVMILFMEKNEKPHVILTLRTDKVSTHKGQISFPGGGFDETDNSYLEAGLRETYEEIGILPEDIEILGEFDEYLSITGYHIYVFAGAVNRAHEYTVSTDEIDEMLEVPFSIFYNNEYVRHEKIVYDRAEYDLFHYEYGKAAIWGLTARILTDFANKVCKEC